MTYRYTIPKYHTSDSKNACQAQTLPSSKFVEKKLSPDHGGLGWIASISSWVTKTQKHMYLSQEV